MHVRQYPLIALAGVVILGGIGAWYVFGSRESAYTTVAVVRGPITQEAFASGNVESPTTSALHFKSSGTLVTLAVAVGQTVHAGDILAKQNTSVLSAQLSEAQAGVLAAKARLAKLRAGATPEAVALSQSQLSVATQTLTNAYTSVPSALTDAYTDATDAIVVKLARFFSSASSANPALTFSVGDFALANRLPNERVHAGAALSSWGSELALLNKKDTDALSAALSEGVTHLTLVQMLLTDAVAAVAANTNLSTTDASTLQTAASAGLAQVNAAITSLESLARTIAADRAAVEAANAALAVTTASSTPEDIAAQEAAVVQAQAGVDAIAAEIRDLEIVAPFSGTVTSTNGVVGEVVTPDVTVVSLVPYTALDVKVNVSEDAIVGVKVGDPARIELDAFPIGTSFPGSVSSVDPAETLVGGAIYYQTTVLFTTLDPHIRSGMTANVWIETASSSDALLVPAAALASPRATTTVRVLVGGVPETRTVTTGLVSQDGMVEIRSGLKEGEEVITGQ